MATSTRNINVSKDEYAVFNSIKPYLAMLIGAALLFGFGVLTRIGIWAQDHYNNVPAEHSTKIFTWVILLSVTILSAISWKLFSIRQQVHHFIAPHATITVILAHVWLLLAAWEDVGDWMFGTVSLQAFLIIAPAVALSWCIRRWAHADISVSDSEYGNPFEVIGLGEDTRIDGHNSHATAAGAVYRMKLALGKTVEMAKDKRTQIAHIAGKPRDLVHISETDSGVEGEVDITILKDNPFKQKIWWQGPDYPGDSIVSPISFATYDTGDRGQIWLAGKDGASSQHFLTMGMSGSGKSKAWQVIYGSVLNRKEVSVVFGDPAKGMQTGGPLAAGLSWFAWTEEDCHEQIKAVMRAIPERTNYLTSKGLSHWQRGCGLNFLIFHLEEAARFAETADLVKMLEAARSAGICIIISLQKATNDRLNTSARYNLGGSLCFGVRDKRDTQLALSEGTRLDGAAPHLWQDRMPGHFYLEATGIDPRMFAHQLVSDWIDEGRLEQEIDQGAAIRSEMDTFTEQALGPVYAQYRMAFNAGTTAWQEMRRNRGHDQTTLEIPTSNNMTASDNTDTLLLPFNVVDSVQSTPTAPLAVNRGTAKVTNLATSPEETARVKAELWSIIEDFRSNGKTQFTPGDLRSRFTARQPAWISKTLATWVKEGSLKKLTTGFYEIVSK